MDEPSCQVGSGNFNLPNELGFQSTYHRLTVISDKRGVSPDRFQRSRDYPLPLTLPRRREVVLRLIPLRKVFVPITHYLVHAPAVDNARQVTHVLDEMTKERRTWHKGLMVDIAIQ